MPYLSALEVCSRQGAIQIYVYLTLRLQVLTLLSDEMMMSCEVRQLYSRCHQSLLWGLWVSGNSSIDTGLPYILAYKPTIFSWILTIKLWGSAYTRVIAQQPELARHGPLVGTCCLPRAGPHANCCCCVCIPVRWLALRRVDASPEVRVRAGCVGVRRRNRGLRRPRGVTMHRSRVLVRRWLPLLAYTRVTSFC